MSIHRFAAKVDSTKADIVKALKQCHIEVYDIRQPVDLLLRFWCNRHQVYCWQPLEVKPAKSDGSPKLRADQQAQRMFIELTQIPVASTFQQAIQGINRHHQVGIT